MNVEREPHKKRGYACVCVWWEREKSKRDSIWGLMDTTETQEKSERKGKAKEQKSLIVTRMGRQDKKREEKKVSALHNNGERQNMNEVEQGRRSKCHEL